MICLRTNRPGTVSGLLLLVLASQSAGTRRRQCTSDGVPAIVGFGALLTCAIIFPVWSPEVGLKINSREAEIAQLERKYGAPLRRRYLLEVSEESYEYRRQSTRRAKVVLFIRRTNGNLLLHTKDFYPKGVFRIPSGGIHRREALLDAVHRETFEETGLQVAVERFLAVVQFDFCWQERTVSLSSYLLLLRKVGGRLEVRDEHECITAFREAAPCGLESVASHLENLPPAWREWGEFRAIPHRLAATVLRQEGGSEYIAELPGCD